MAVIQHGEQVVGEEPDLQIDPGAPFSHDFEPEAEPAAVATTDDEKPLTAAEGKALREELAQSRQDAVYWSERARTSGPQRVVEMPAAPAAEEIEADPFEGETAEQLLDAIAKEGITAIEKRGFVRASDVHKMVRAEIDTTANDIIAGQTFDALLNRDFPELTDPASRMSQLAGKHFRELVAIDPSAKNSKVTLISAARLAKSELAAEERVAQQQQTDRRDRIDVQRGAPRVAAEPSNEFRMSPLSQQIMQNLSRHLPGATPAEKANAVTRFSGVRASSGAKGGR